MRKVNNNNLENTSKHCNICHKKIPAEKAFDYDSKNLCEDCCMELRTPRVRKTHWQYLSSIKADYLIPGKH